MGYDCLTLKIGDETMPKTVKTEEELLDAFGESTVTNIGSALRARRGGRGIVDRSTEKTTKDRIETAIDEYFSDDDKDEVLEKVGNLSEAECRALSKIAKEMSKEFEEELGNKKLYGDIDEDDNF